MTFNMLDLPVLGIPMTSVFMPPLRLTFSAIPLMRPITRKISPCAWILVNITSSSDLVCQSTILYYYPIQFAASEKYPFLRVRQPSQVPLII